jgi:hypothetical protein
VSTLAVDGAIPEPVATAVSRLAVAGLASMGAGAVHAAAIGVHAEHRQAVIAFAVVAVFQLAWGAVALTRSHPLLGLLGAVGNAAAVGGFVLAKTSGISFVDGLEAAEGVQLADGIAAALAGVSVLLALGAVLASAGEPRRGPRWLVPAAGLAVAALALPAMASAGSHAHAEGAAGDHGHGSGADPAAEAAHAAAASVPPKAYDPTKPIDLSGVPGVTPEQQARAENLIAITLLRLPRFADPAVAEAEGFRTIGDGFTGHEHYINWSYLDDGHLLDPDRPESLVYQTFRDGRPRQLVAAMYMLGSTDTLDDVPDLGGALTQWHVHEDLCFTDTPGDHKVRALTRPDGTCAPPLVKPAQGPMIHVWITPHECGPFASLEGVAGGQIKPGETRLCDHAHGAGGAPA